MTPAAEARRGGRRWLLAAGLVLAFTVWGVAELAGTVRGSPPAPAVPAPPAQAAAESPPPPAEAEAGRPLASAPRAAALDSVPALPGLSPAMAARAALETAAADEAARSVPGTWMLCGLGRVAAEPVAGRGGAAGAMSYELPAAHGREALKALWPRLRAQLLGSADPRLQAAAWHLPGPDGAPPTLRSLEPASRQARSALAALALAHPQDALVMAWAQRACLAVPADCLGLKPRLWVRQEPDNAAAWLYWLNDESAAADEALAGLAAATRIDFGTNRLAGTVLAVMPPDLPAYLAIEAADALLLIDNMVAVPAMQRLMQLCRAAGAATEAPARRSACEQVWQRMADGGADLMSRMLGLSLARSMGTPPQQLAERRARLDRLMRVMSDEHNQRVHGRYGQEPHGCAATAARRQFLQDLATKGEWATLTDLQPVHEAGAEPAPASGAAHPRR